MKTKTVFFCTDCGNETPKWQGKCNACGAWNTLVEQPKMNTKKQKAVPQMSSFTSSDFNNSERRPKKVYEIDTESETRFQTNIGELDRVLGGGAVLGSLILVGGEPGIGKSTLMLQISQNLSKNASVLYVSGEESERQLKLRTDRIATDSDRLYLYAENNLETILESVHRVKPNVLIVDSIQTLYHNESSSSPGSVSQIKECTMFLMRLAKEQGITIFIIGHVNKEGSLAGPKILEHMVDCVLYFEGEQRTTYRILRTVKNRYGATNEIGMFEMSHEGLIEIPNPSELLLSGRLKNAPGACVTCVMEGVRPVLAEIQALLASTNYGHNRRTSDGLDYNRALLLQAVLEKRGGLHISACDVYLNVVGGLTLNEPAIDLALILSMASSFRDKAIPEDMVAIGEVGLTGEVRGVNHLNERLAEVKRLGFQKCMISTDQNRNIHIPEGLHVIKVSNIREALASIL